MKIDAKHYIEMGGGLGDIFQNCYVHGGYRFLSKMAPYETAEVVLITHHPMAASLDVKCPGYWESSQDREMRLKHGLPINPQCDYWHNFEPVVFYPSPADLQLIEELKASPLPYLVVSASAGLPERDLPEQFVHRVVSALAERMRIVFVGRRYDRHGRRERSFYVEPGVTTGRVWNTIDMLTVPGVAELVRGAIGVMTCHSAVSMVAWYMRKPNLLLYPKSVVERHISKNDQWSFGCRYAETVHGCVTDKVTSDRVDIFIERMLVAASNAKPKFG
jgi:ADP-heptose:LPS heptosyltransferase